MYHLQISSMLSRKYLIMGGNYYLPMLVPLTFNFCKNTELQFFSQKSLGSKSSSKYLVVWVCWYLLDILSGNWEVPVSHVSTTFLCNIVVFFAKIQLSIFDQTMPAAKTCINSACQCSKGLTLVWYHCLYYRYFSGKICR